MLKYETWREKLQKNDGVRVFSTVLSNFLNRVKGKGRGKWKLTVILTEKIIKKPEKNVEIGRISTEGGGHFKLLCYN